MSINKYSWDDVDTTTPVEQHKESSEPSGQSSDTEPTTNKSNTSIEEILNAPTEAINNTVEQLKEVEHAEDEVAKLESSNESLRNMLVFIKDKGCISREDRTTLIEIQPDIPLEEASEYTSTPSHHLLDETEETIQEQICTNECTINQKIANDYYNTALRLLTYGDNRPMEGDNLEPQAIMVINEKLGKVYGKTESLSLRLTTVRTILDKIYAQLIEEKRQAREDLNLAIYDKEVLEAVETRYDCVAEYIGQDPEVAGYSFLFNEYDNPKINKVTLEQFIESNFKTINSPFTYLAYMVNINRISNLLDVIYFNGDIYEPSFNEKLDECGQELSGLYNSIADWVETRSSESNANMKKQLGIAANVVNRLLYNQYWNRKSIDEVLKPIVKDTNGKELFGKHCLQVLNSNFNRLEHTIVGASSLLIGEVSSNKLYLDWYNDVLIKSIKDNMVKGQDDDTYAALSVLNNLTKEVIRYISYSFLTKVVAYNQLYTFYNSCKDAMALVLDFLGQYSESEPNETFSEEINNLVRQFGLQCKTVAEEFRA
jgi:hypothetical protein